MLPVCLAAIPYTKCGAAILQFLLSTFDAFCVRYWIS